VNFREDGGAAIGRRGLGQGESLGSIGRARQIKSYLASEKFPLCSPGRRAARGAAETDDNRPLRISAYRLGGQEAGLAKLVIFKKGGGGKVAINPEQVTHVRSAAGAFTDVFMGGQQVAVEGSFEEVVSLLAGLERRAPAEPASLAPAQKGLVFNRPGAGI